MPVSCSRSLSCWASIWSSRICASCSNYRIAALVLTHGHEDHIGAVPHVLPYVQGPVYGTPLTLAFVEGKLDDDDEARKRLIRVRPRDRVTIGAFTVEFLRVTHSMPDCVALAIHTPHGVVIHTGDFKIDQTPLDGEHVDVHRLAELGSAGVLALIADSTEHRAQGICRLRGRRHRRVRGDLHRRARQDRRRDVRVEHLPDADPGGPRGAVRPARRLRRPRRDGQLGDRRNGSGISRIPTGVQIRDSEVRNFPAQDVLCICTGSQGEPQAALPRIAIDDHRHVKLDAEDVVVFSAREIPGNEKAIGRVMNHIARRHADVIYEGIKHVHVSGHGSEEELKLMLSLVRPRYFVPIHGEYRQLARHARMAPRVSRSERRCCWPRTATSSASTATRDGSRAKCRPGAS